MKKYFIAMTAIGLISIAPNALAASSADLIVRGTITPSACTPTLSEGGNIDHGKFLAGNLNQINFTVIGTHRMRLNVACDSASTFAINAIDNKSGTADRPGEFGLGLSEAGEKLGRIEIEIKNNLADGLRRFPISSQDGGATWIHGKYFDPGSFTSFSEISRYTPIAIKDLMLDLEVKSIITRADRLTLTDEVTIDGSATFEMKYL